MQTTVALLPFAESKKCVVARAPELNQLPQSDIGTFKYLNVR